MFMDAYSSLLPTCTDDQNAYIGNWDVAPYKTR